ncbi:phosphatidate cytidylyltransferase [Elusimicrobiota bacterium]
MLLPRLITAIIGIPLILLSVFWGGIPFFVLMLGVVFLATREYFILVEAKYVSQPLMGVILGTLLFVFLFLGGTEIGALTKNQGTVAFLSLILIPVFIVEILKKNHQQSLERIAITFLGIFFIPWTLGHLVLIRNLRPNGVEYVFFLFVVVWILDTGAYFIGKRFGRYKLASNISPKKTIEGGIGGVVTGVVASILFCLFFLKDDIGIGEAAILGLIISVVSQASDLAESLIKRDVGVKDSADLLPGHGGMLDRFDSYFFAAPVLYYYLILIR